MSSPRSPLPHSSTSSLLARQHQSLLSRLVTHFINAKQSLASTEQVSRANDLVTGARSAIESIAITTAGNKCLLLGAQKQIMLAERVLQAIDRVREKGDGEFKSVLRELDAADARTKKTLELLKTTQVDSCFQSSVAAAQPRDESSASEDSGKDDGVKSPRYLYDFVSERGVEELTRFFRDRIDETNAASAKLVDSLNDFNDRLQHAKQILGKYPLNVDDIRTNNAGSASAFRSLEAHAEDTAEALQSLVRHYDRCVEALKHTEGGAEAAAANGNTRNDVVGESTAENNEQVALFGQVSPNLLSAAERADMLEVLENDALEVNDVVLEIIDHLREMELQADQIGDHLAALQTGRSGLKKAVQSLDSLGHQMAVYLRAGPEYLDVWTSQRKQIEDRMVELDGAHEFYERFMKAYDGTILEIHRRRDTQMKLESVMAEAMTKFEKLYQEDLEQRQAYLEEHSHYIPSDLWTGVTDEPARFDIVRTDESGDDLPVVSKETVQAAVLRLKAAQL